MAVSFPSNPSDGDTFTAANGVTYAYSSSINAWKGTANAAVIYLAANSSGAVPTATGEDAVAIGEGAVASIDNEIMLGGDRSDGGVGIYGVSGVLYRDSDDTSAVWANIGVQPNNNMFFRDDPNFIDDFDFARHNYEQFKRLASGNVTVSDVPEISYYTQAQVDDSTLVGASLGDISRVIKSYIFSGNNSSSNGYVIKTFHYDSDGNLIYTYLTHISGDLTGAQRNSIFSSSGDLDTWSVTDGSPPHAVGEFFGSGGTYVEGLWTGFDKSNAAVSLGLTGNVRMLGQQLIQYDTDGNLTNSRFYARRASE